MRLLRPPMARTEIAVGVQPTVRTVNRDVERRRMNPFTGRALTERVLTGEQAHRSLHIARLNRTLSPGVVQGCDLAFAALAAGASVNDPPPAELDLARARVLVLGEGTGVAATGEEVVVVGEPEIDVLDLPVVAPPWLLDGQPAPPPGPPVALETRIVGAALRDVLGRGIALPRAGVILLEPAEFDSLLTFDERALLTQCERDEQAEAFDDEVRQEAVHPVFYAWPEEWLPLPVPDLRWRNRLAHAVFAREAGLGAVAALPWWDFGVPVSLVGFNAAWEPLFADRAAVVRKGGRPLAKRAVTAGSGDRFLWQARIEQLVEHIEEERALGATTEELAVRMRFLPPAGLLPADAVQPRAAVNVFFPPTITLTAAPVPEDQLDTMLEDSAALATIDLQATDDVRVLVPVPNAVFERDLLVVEVPDADGEIARAIGRYGITRSDWLNRRELLRAKERALRVAIEGARVPPLRSLTEDPLRLEPEAAGPIGTPPASAPLHRNAAVAGMHQHGFHGATALSPAAGDALFVHLFVDFEHPPREVMVQFRVGTSWEHRAYWGENLIAFGADGSASRLRIGDLPQGGAWMRVQLDPQALGLAGAQINGMAFTVFDGRAAWGMSGLTRADGTQTPWTTRALIEAATRFGDGESWEFVPFVDLAAPLEAAFGFGVGEDQADAAGARTLPDFDEVVARFGSMRLRSAAATGAAMSAAPLSRTIEADGLSGAVRALEAAVDRTNDAIDLGFVRVQTDLYRLRQSVLKQSQATRFAVSPALTQIADLDNAVATREQLAEFYNAVRGQPSGPTEGGAAVVGTSGGAAGGGTSGGGGAGALGGGEIAGGIAFAPMMSNTGGSGTSGMFMLAQPLAGSALAAMLERQNLAARAGTFQLAAPPSEIGTPTGVIEAGALTGSVHLRTSSIAARMELPRSIETKNFTVATRIDILGRLRDVPIDLEDLPVAGLSAEGFDDAGQPLRTRTRPLGELLALPADQLAAALADRDPREDRRDESAYFLGGVDLSDFTIGLLRGLEGRVAGVRTALARCKEALAALQAQLSALRSRLAVVDRELSEARQDVATARALLAEEVARAAAVNARRDGIVRDHVKYLAYARPRIGKRLQDIASRRLDNAFEPDTVPACFAEHAEVPAELAGMLRVVRHAPVRWFPAARAIVFELVDHPALLDALVANLAPRPALALGFTATANALQVAAQAVTAAQAGAATQERLQAAEPLRLAASASLTVRRELYLQAASAADLIGAIDVAPLSRRAAAEFERIGQIAGCLHARLCETRAALRLTWAERFSQFDVAGDLGDLSLLPRIGEVPEPLREDIVELAGWLRRRADPAIPRAVSLMNDLLRVCLLAASHSPVNQIVSGRVVRPVPLRPGVRFEVQAFLPERVRAGMQVQVFEGAEVAARGVVDDIAGGVAAVRVVEAVQLDYQPGAAATVRFAATLG